MIALTLRTSIYQTKDSRKKMKIQAINCEKDYIFKCLQKVNKKKRTNLT